MISYIRGYYVITAEGTSIERFMNYIIRSGIHIYNVERISPTKIRFYVDRKDIRKFKAAFKKSEYNLKVTNSIGIPFIAKRIYKHKLMWIGAILSFLFLLFTSQFVTDIHIKSPEGIDKEEVREELYSLGLKPGVYKKSIDRKEIRDSIMTEFDDVAYVSINVKGTNIYVTITKKAETLESKDMSSYCNIISSKDGVVEKVIPRSGESLVSTGDVIKTGDTLINGSNTTSIPEVWASTFYEVKLQESYSEVKKEKTGKKKKVYTLSVYDEDYTLRRDIKYKDYIIENEEYKLEFLEYTFPVKLKVSTFYETTNKTIEKDKDELKDELCQKALKELDYIVPPSARIIDVVHDFSVNKNMLEYIITVQASENVAEIYPLSKSEAESMLKSNKDKKEESGEVVPSNPEKRPINDIRNEFEEKEDDTKDKEGENDKKQ